MKKIILILVSVLLGAGILTGCGNVNVKNNDKISIVTTIFPEYDWVREILGGNADKAEVTMLLDKGVDLHSYQPTADDMVKIGTCDLLIYVGGESDKWIEDALKNAANKDMIVIKLLDVLGDNVKAEEMVEGMQAGEHEHDEHSEGEAHKDEEEHEHEEADEHVWLSLNNAKILCKVIADKISELDSDNKEVYQKNAAEYIEALNALDNEYKTAVNNSANKTILFGDRFPFRYLADDYNIAYYAAFVGCSAETEASFETVSFLAKKADELKLPCVLTIENAQHKIAQTIIDNTKDKNQKILVMDSMQSVTSKDVSDGVTYISIMKKNLEVLEAALK